MGSSFATIGIARSGMYVSQSALDVTNHNISNVNTVGYVRQQAITKDLGYRKDNGGQIGSGVDLQTVRQIRNDFLDQQYRREMSDSVYWSTKCSTIQDVESVMGELWGNSMEESMNYFFSSWDELSKDPNNLSARSSVVQYGISFIDDANHISKELDRMQDDLNMEIQQTVENINEIAEQIAALNSAIIRYEANGDSANDYRDQRNVLLDQLSELTDITVTEKGSGAVTVGIGGVMLVDDAEAQEILCECDSSGSSFVTPRWENSGRELNLSGGELLGLIECRGDVDGSEGSAENGSPVESGYEESDVDYDASQYCFDPDSESFIPEMRKGLNQMISLVTRKINCLHSEGMGLDGSTGLDFFIRMDETLPFEMGNIQVNPVLQDPNKVAASLTGDTGDGSNAQRIIEWKDEPYFKSGNKTLDINDYYQSMISWAATEGEKAQSSNDSQLSLVSQIDNQRKSLSSVSMDEEMANMMKFQNAYNACSRVITTMDGLLDIVINQM